MFLAGPLAAVAGVAVMAFLYKDEINPKHDFPNYELYFQETAYEDIQRARNLKPEVCDFTADIYRV